MPLHDAVGIYCKKGATTENQGEVMVYYYLILDFAYVVIYAVWTSFFRARFTSFHAHASLITFFVCFFVLFRSCCSHVRVEGKTFVHELPISYSHTEWYISSLFARRNSLFGQKLRLSKSN